MSLLRKFPKYAFVFAVIAVSSGLFCLWWFTRKPKTQPVASAPYSAPAKIEPPPVVDPRAGWADKVRGKLPRLFLADNDLYDMEVGTVLIKGWLQHGMPRKILWDEETGNLMALYPNARVRYGLDGRETGRLPGPSEMFVSADDKWAVFVRNKDMWHADLDKASFKIVNEKQVTTLGQFWGSSLSDNVLMAGEKSLVFRHQNQLLRIKFEIGEVKPLAVPTWQIDSRRSPDGRYLVGIEKEHFLCMDVDSDDITLEKVGNAKMDSAQWLGNERCVFLASGRALMEYTRGGKGLSKLIEFAKPFRAIGFPSPDQRYLFCVGNNAVALVDLKSKKELPVGMGAGYSWVNDDTLIFSRDVLDTSYRGTWMQKVGQAEKRISLEPFIAGPGESAERMPELGIAVAFTKRGLLKIPVNGDGEAKLIPTTETPRSGMTIGKWSG